MSAPPSPFPGIVQAIEPEIIAEFERAPAGSRRTRELSLVHDGTEVVGRLEEWSRQVDEVAPEQSVKEDLAGFARSYRRYNRPAAGTASMLVSHYHVRRQEPGEARRWNSEARRYLGGLEGLPSVALEAQLTAIELQSDNIDKAEQLKRRLENIELPEPYGRWLDSLLNAVEQRKLLESGKPSTPTDPFEQAIFALQGARFREALDLLQGVRAGLEPGRTHGVDLNIARARLGLGELERGLAQLEDLSRHFGDLELHKFELSANVYAADARRLLQDFAGARRLAQSSLEEALALGLKKESFRAYLVLAQVEMAEGKQELARQYLNKAGRSRDKLQTKDRCTLYRSRAQLETRAGNLGRSRRWRREAQELLDPSAVEEKALLAANLGVAEVWLLARRGQLEEALDCAREHLASIEPIVFGDSHYSAETYPYLYAGRLYWAAAFCEVRARNPTAALEAAAKAHEILNPVPELGARLRGKVAFVEALAHAECGDFDATLACLDRAAQLASNHRPIVGYIEELKQRDDPGVVDQMAFELFHVLEGSSQGSRFEPYREDLALAIAPYPELSEPPPSFEVPSDDWNALALFVESYEKTLREHALAERDVPAEDREEYARIANRYMDAMEPTLEPSGLRAFLAEPRRSEQLERIWSHARKQLVSSSR